jgi:hypothetical protein
MENSSAKKTILNNLNRIGETLYILKFQVEKALGNMALNSDPRIQQFTKGHRTYLDLWRSQFNDKFFDMATFVRLGSETELAFRNYYMDQKGHSSILNLKRDPAVKNKGNIFQRVKKSSTENLQTLYLSELQIDLMQIPEFAKVIEFIIHRHLYTHNSGIIDDQYLADLKDTCGIDLLSTTQITSLGYPNQDVYWFEPLKRLPAFYEAIKATIYKLP